MVLPTKTHTKDLSFDGSGHPIVIRNAIEDWPAAAWTAATIRSLAGECTTRVRFHRHVNGHTPWEGECVYRDVLVSEFVEWMQRKSNKSSGLACEFNRDEWWGYMDYKQFESLLGERAAAAAGACDWSRFGVDVAELSSLPVLWLGTAGAVNPCHRDAYGYNLVAQLRGRKRWRLFPPEALRCVATRLPFEACTVFSAADVRRQDLARFPELSGVPCMDVVLEPGSVLYVPRHWYHFVECLDDCLSVNQWVDLPSDTEDRVREGVTRTLLSSLLPPPRVQLYP